MSAPSWRRIAAGTSAAPARPPSLCALLLAGLLLAPPAGCSAQVPGEGASAGGVILDGRELPGAAGAGELEVPEALGVMLRAAEAHATREGKEMEGPSRPMAAAEGSFTAPGAREQVVLSLVTPWPRCCPTLTLALFRDGVPVAHHLFEGTFHGLSVVPGGADGGADLLVLAGSFGMGGNVMGSATFLRWEGMAPREVGTAWLFEDSCAAMRPGAGGVARVIRAAEGGGFSVESYRSDCSDAWEREGDAVPLELEAPWEPMEWVELPLPGR